MAEADTPHAPPAHAPPMVLPDGIHTAVRPGTALLRLETTGSREGVLAGAWWPRSRDVAGELPTMIAVLTEYLGPITRVGLDASAWDGITRGENDHFALLLVPPGTAPEAARTAMARAVEADNTTSAADLLIAPVPPLDPT
ncbi:DUF5994 family protein [Streptomyces sp. NPDC090112]|uniref:DUF5994 family protein n=1 Tax=Streptomyces sp. NPDC090112 TaxID=3365949 RepID=UPI003826D4BA